MSQELEPRFDRRTLLRRGAGALVASTSAGALLAACGSGPPNTESRAVARRSVGIDVDGFLPPITDLRRLVLARAKERGALVTLSDDASGSAAQVANLRTWTGPHGGFRALAVAPFDPAAVAPLVQAATRSGIDVVSYVGSIDGATASISIDPAQAGSALADNAAAWAARALGGRGQVLLVRPSAAPTSDPYLPLAPRVEQALRTRLASRAPQLVPVAATTAQAAADGQAAVARALQTYPDVRVVLCWNDTTAAGAAQALLAHHGAGEAARLYAGGHGTPAVASRAMLEQLQKGGVLKALAAARLRTLANALVDVPFALLQGGKPHDVTVPVTVLTPTSPDLPRQMGDYSRES